ncbi:hypothetical protein [Actinoplanes rectilineatus]|uniref:hypothetical protein n=1 Tax=Actinoplanes rectilineatus TaxID=113571 RepID=UPI0005F2AC05|nr:hypothetical protein [Actinoplanes rectilineatus]
MQKKILAGLAAVALAVGAGTLGLTRPWAAAPGDRVPGGLELPWMWQATVDMGAPGPASVLAGGDTLGFQGGDFYDAEGKIAVVGRDGDYRMLLQGGWNDVAAGEDVLLSPDGTRVARPAVDVSGLEVVDLTSGKAPVYTGGNADSLIGPVAWSPEGRSLLVALYAGGAPEGNRFALLDLDTDTLQPLGEVTSTVGMQAAARGAISPDGTRIVLTDGATLRAVDRTGATAWTTTLGERQRLAGAGAFSPDGARIAVAELDGCLDACDEDALAARRWTISYRDATTGAATTGPVLPAVTGSGIRALGWSQGRDLVVLRYEPEDDAFRPARGDASTTGWDDTGWYETGHLTLLALGPDGTTRTLLDPPDGVLTLDVARDLLEAGSFGGPTPTADPFPARGIIWLALAPILLIASPLLFGLALHLRRRRAYPVATGRVA